MQKLHILKLKIIKGGMCDASIKMFSSKMCI